MERVAVMDERTVLPSLAGGTAWVLMSRLLRSLPNRHSKLADRGRR